MSELQICMSGQKVVYILLIGSNNQFRNYESRIFTKFLTNQIVFDKK